MPRNVISLYDGQKTQVSDLIQNPKLVPTRVQERLENAFLAEALLEDAGKSPTPVVAFERNTQVFLEDGPEVVGEFGEIPAVNPTSGETVQGVGVKLGAGIDVSREMIDYNQMNRVNRSIRQLTNTFIRANDRMLRQALLNANVPEIAASVAWNQQGADPRYDIAKAQETIGAGGALSVDDDRNEFIADSIVFSPAHTPGLVANEKFNAIYGGNIADKNIRYTGVLPQEIMGMTAFRSRTWGKDRVLVLERKVVGFFTDARPLESTELRERNDDTETWRSNTTQIRFVGIDEPFAACWITGVWS